MMVAPYNPPVKNEDFVTRIALCDKYGNIIDNPTIEAGDFKVDKDGAGLVNLATLPVYDYHANQVLMLHGEDLTDVEGHTVTNNGVTVDELIFKSGRSSLYFYNPGSTYLTLDGSTDFNLGTGDFTIDCWMRKAAAVLQWGTIISWEPSGGGGFRLQNEASIGAIRVWFSGELFIGSTVLNINQWYHVALTRSGTTVRLFINGVQDGSGTSSADIANVANRPVVGARGSDLAETLYGWLDNLRVIKGTALWTSNFTPPARYNLIKLALSATEMNADVVTIVGVDQTSSKQWSDFVMTIPTSG